MSSPSLIEPSLVTLDVDLGATPAEVIASLAGIVAATGRAEASGLAADALAREEKSSTGMPGGFAIPHCRSAAVSQASLGFARLPSPVDFGAKDGPADIVFLIAAAAEGGADHLKLLTKLARALVKPEFLAGLRAAATPDEIVSLVRGVVEPAAEPAPAAGAVPTPAPAAAGPVTAGAATTIAAITACPTGIAHTYMAADYLVNAGKELGVDVLVEPQGSSATEPLSAEQISAASAVIFATDVGVLGRERFAGLPVIESGVKRAINEPRRMIEEAIAAAADPQARRVAGDASAATATAAHGSQLGWGKRIQQALMTGVSYMIPFVAAGGLLIALGFLFGGYTINASAADIILQNSLTNLPPGGLMEYIGAVLFALGGAAFGFLVPALAGYIAFGIADRPGIAPGFTAGAVAVATGAGFLGGLVGGLIAGLIAYAFGRLQVPRWLAGLMPVVIIPLFTTLLTGGLMYLVLARPIAALMTAMTSALQGLNDTPGLAIVLGVILGLMMCFDLGGPVNKAAYLFATAGLSIDNQGSLQIMAAVMAAGMVPPLAMALATTLRPKLFTEVERENGRAAWLLGASFISEGAIPFAAADPLRVIPSMMAGGAVTGALSMALQVTSKAPHGGIFVFFAIDPIWGFVAALLAGVVVSGLLVLALKSIGAPKTSTV
ncbi:PTS fructose transporter subunit IIABC [Propionicicella superfundia]|uniref:PTS fructose transporter subunit IIABC n=1 Tax=Propionicicella superfundia TaxID=348582 RepID=UPI00041A7ADA|nr:fructose-specific PTS transporter subunit EIIC [Propionicicella superfundia]